MQIYDCHIHSDFSFDGKSSIEDIVASAIGKGAKAITITDHALPELEKYAPYEHIEKSVAEVRHIAEKYNDKLLILAGVERDDEYPPEYREPFYDLDLDCVLGSVHTQPLFREHFQDSGYENIRECMKTESLDFLSCVVKKYYFRLKNIAYYADVDVITHLTFPFRYINGYAKRGLEIEPFYKEIDEVLSGVIETDKTLEINTSGKAIDWNEFMPNADVLKRYFKMGGKNISLGSDAHKCENVALAFLKATDMLREIGFTHGSYFVKRKRQEYKL